MTSASGRLSRHGIVQAARRREVPLSVARFRANRPQVKVSIEVGSLDFVFESIEREKADVGVFFLPREHPLTVCRQIASLDMICALPRGHPLESKEVVEASDLVEHPFIRSS